MSNTTSAAAAVTCAILFYASYHAELIQSIDSLSNIPTELEEHTRYMQSLQEQIKCVKANLEEMRETTMDKRKKRALRSSVVRKTASKLVGRKEEFNAKAEREESEYVEALETEMHQRAELEALENKIDDTTLKKLSLESKVLSLQTLQTNLSSLYSRVFAQKSFPFPSSSSWASTSTLTSPSVFPSSSLESELLRADEAHESAQKAQDSLSSIQSQLFANQNAVTWLTEAKDLIYVCVRYIEEGLTHYASWGTAKSGVLSHMDRELRSAVQTGAKAQMLVDQARSGEPLLQVLPPLVLDVGDGCSVIGTNSDIILLNKVKTHKSNLVTAQNLISSDIRSANCRIQQLKLILPWAEEAFREADKELTRIRRDIWDGVATGRCVMADRTGELGSVTDMILDSYYNDAGLRVGRPGNNAVSNPQNAQTTIPSVPNNWPWMSLSRPNLNPGPRPATTDTLAPNRYRGRESVPHPSQSHQPPPPYQLSVFSSRTASISSSLATYGYTLESQSDGGDVSMGGSDKRRKRF